MNDDMPKLELVPKSVFQIAMGVDPFYVLESPAEIRAKLTELKNDYSGGLGEENDESGLLVLTEIELHTRPEVNAQPMERSVNPNLIGFIKEVTPHFWADQLRTAAEANEHWKHIVANQQEGDPLAGMPGPVREMIEGLASGHARVISAGGKDMTAEEFGKEGGPEVQCCCGHQAQVHEVGEKVGSCTVCPCRRFHTH